MSFPNNDNKLEGDIKDIFKPDQQMWDRRELEVISEINTEYLKKKEKSNQYFEEMEKELKLKGSKIMPHQKSIETIIYDCRKLIVDIFNIVSREENPFKFIMSSQDNIFSFCIILIISGTIIFMVSNLMLE
tara:strand:- start:1357 stop:1749 length:393 start_codon:yes stop_codon:yes gene_type:complete